MAQSIKNKIEFLANAIKRHKNEYYNKKDADSQVISDPAFDALEDALRELDPEHPELTCVGIESQSEWSKAKHAIPMGSLDKRKTPEQMAEWIRNTIKVHNTIFVTEKLDGLSIEIIYAEGNLIQAITRGDGIEGDDITPNVLRMQGVLQALPIPFTGSLRGEIVLKKSTFASDKFFAEYANTRNAAAGISKRLDGVGCEHLLVLFYQAIGSVSFDTEEDQFDFIYKKLGLLTTGYEILDQHNIDAYVELVNRIWHRYQQSTRAVLDWEIDGLVIRINELTDQKALGDIHLRPKGAMAFKFKEEKATTTVTAIQLQVGNSGRITPVLEVEPVHLVGVTVNRASLYNFAYVRELGIDVGAKVVIVRANDVIPRCEAVLEPVETVFQPPAKCPICAGRVEMIGENLQCMETDTCPAQVVGRLKNWINTLNIMEWGDKLLARLVESGFVVNITDLYKLEISDLLSLERMGQKSAIKCYDILWSHNPIPLDLFIGGLSIPMVGASTIQLLIDNGLDTLTKLMNAQYEEIVQVKGMGPVRARCLVDGLLDNKDIITELFRLGIIVGVVTPKDLISKKLDGMSICITGSTNIKRESLIQIIKSNGGISKNSIDKNCTHLIVADPSKKSKKTENANKLGLKLISEKDFLTLIE